MLKMGLLWNAEPKYSRLKKEEEEEEEEEKGEVKEREEKEYRNGNGGNRYETVDVFEDFEVSDTKDSPKDTSGEYSRYHRVAKSISWFSVIFGFTSGVASLVMGQIFGSETLFGYGLDAVLDSFSSVACLWRFYSKCSDEEAEAKERKACIVISLLFFASSISLLAKSIRGLVKGDIEHNLEETEHIVSDIFSGVCGVIAVTTATIKVYYGTKLHSKSLVTDSIITFVGAFMSLMSVLSMELHEYDSRIWYLDGASGLACATFLLIFGIKILTQMTCLYRRSHACASTKEVT